MQCIRYEGDTMTYCEQIQPRMQIPVGDNNNNNIIMSTGQSRMRLENAKLRAKNMSNYQMQQKSVSQNKPEATTNLIQNMFLNQEIALNLEKQKNKMQQSRSLQRVQSNNRIANTFIIKKKDGGFDNVKSYKQLPEIANPPNLGLTSSNQQFHKSNLKHPPSLKQQVIQNQKFVPADSSPINHSPKFVEPPPTQLESVYNRSILNEKIKMPLANQNRGNLNKTQFKQQHQRNGSHQLLQQQMRLTHNMSNQKILICHPAEKTPQKAPLAIKPAENSVNLSSLIRSIKKHETPLEEEEIRREKASTVVVSKKHFEFSHVVGRGGFGKVWKVTHRKTQKVFAMKEMLKAKVIVKKSVHSVMNERNLLSQIKNDFIVNMQSAFQDQQNLYLIMDYLPGGDLRFHIGKMRRFNENQTKFFSACLILGLYNLHKNSIIHRDIKPENLVLDRKGYLRLTDLGIARVIRADNYQDTSGTPGYMAPEVMCRQNHSYEVDYFAMGVIIYEFMLGKRPYYGRNRKEIREQMIQKQVQVRKQEKPEGWSEESVNIVNLLLQRKPDQRLGFSGIESIMNHPWFSSMDWLKLEKKQLASPYLPTSKDNNFDPRQLQSTESDEEVTEQNNLLLRKNSMQNLFSGYYFDSKEAPPLPAKTGNASTANTIQYNFSQQSQNIY